MIVVVGGTGNVGREVVRGLRRHGADVRVVARGRQPVPDGVELVAADLSHPRTLDRAFAGAELAFVVTSPDPRAAELQGNAFDAAARAGVRHLVKSSVLGAAHDSPARLLRWHAEAEDRLRAAGPAWTTVRPNLFLQFVLEASGRIARDGALLQPAGRGRVSVVDRRDHAAVVVAVLTEDGHEERGYDVTGPEALTMAELADRVSARLRRPVRQADPPLDAFGAQLAAAGLPAFLVEGLVELYQLYRDGDRGAARVTGDVEAVLGRPARPADDLIAEIF